MKYEISDIIQNKYIYGLTILRIHKKADKGVTYKMILKIPIYSYFLVHFLFLLINSMNVLILCGDFIPNSENIYLSTVLSSISPYFLVNKFYINNLTYLISCSFLITICTCRYIYFYYLIQKTKNYHLTEVYNIRVNFIIVVLNHLVYIFFSYIIEFLSFICYIELFPDLFIIKKSASIKSYVNYIFIVINIIFIFVYNYNNYQSIELMNRQCSDKKYPFRMRIRKLKLYILIFFQNMSIFQPLTIYLKNNENNISKIINIIIDILIIFLFILAYINSLKSFNYNNMLNKILSFIGEFCFTSMILEIILYSLSINQNSFRKLVSIILIKLLVTICLYFLLEKIYEKIMLREIKKKLFLNTSNNYSFNKGLVNNLLYIKELIEYNNNKVLVHILKFLYNHQKFCNNKHCGCKIIKITSCKESDIYLRLNDYLKQINYYIESILIKFDFHTNYELSYLISEHFFVNKNNPIMAYSVLQTLLHYNFHNLSTKELVFIYGTLNKYIKSILKGKINKVNLEKFNNNTNELFKCNKENELKQYFNILIKIKKITKLMKEYSISFNKIIKYKEIYENSIQIELDERDGEIYKINSSLLTNSFISELIHFLSDENNKTTNIKKFIYDLKEYNKILSYEFIYKCFLFIDYFWNAIIPNDLIEILYGFTTNRNLYNNFISQEIYELLEDNYLDYYNSEKKKYYLLLKYTKGLKISYISETLTRKLNIIKEDINNQDMSVLLIKDLNKPHNNAVNQYFMIKQQSVFLEKLSYIFDSKKYMIEQTVNSTFQIGLNKNILIICILQLNMKNKDIIFFANKNLEIISINQSFEDNFCLSLPLIEEFKIEIKDLFGIVKNNIIKKNNKEIRIVKEIKNFIRFDPKEHVLKNIFSSDVIKDNYRFIDDNLFNDNKGNEEDNNANDDEKIQLKPKIKNSFLKVIKNIFDNKVADMISLRTLKFKISNEIMFTKMKNLIEKISFYEQGKLENKNIYKDYLRLSENYNNIFTKNNIFFVLNIKQKLIYDTSFYLCKVEIYENNALIKDYTHFLDRKLLKDDDKKNIFTHKLKVKTIVLKSEKEREVTKKNIHFRKSIQFKNNSHREKIRTNKISKKFLGIILVSLIFILLIVYIIILIYQMSLIEQGNKIFKALFYTYYQKSKLLYIYSVTISIHFNLVNLTDISTLNENQKMLRLLIKNLEDGFHLFYKYYMEYKSYAGEDVQEMYSLKPIKQISVNWMHELIYNNYINEMQLMLYRIYDISRIDNYTEGDKTDCEYFLLENYQKLEKDRETTEIHGNLIKILYYLFKNYDSVYSDIYDELTLSFEKSFNNYTNKTVISYLALEFLGMLIYFIFFLINFIFLFRSNKYIFQNLLCIFLDFTQKNKYTFNNKNDNILLNRNILNYISLLNEFSPKKLENLYDNYHQYSEMFSNANLLNEKEKNELSINDIVKTSKKNNVVGCKTKKVIKSKNSTNKLEGLNFLSNIKMKINDKESSDITDNNRNINKLNFENLCMNFNNSGKNMKNKVDNNSLNLSDYTNHSSFLGLNDLKTLGELNGNEKQEEIKKNEVSDYTEYSNLTIDKIILLSKIVLIQAIKVIMIIFIIFSIIFIVYYIVKIVCGFLIITKIGILFDDFRILVSQYNEVVYYWKNIKILFILPNSPIYKNMTNVESYFNNEQNRNVLNLITTRISYYKRTAHLYNLIFNPKDYKDLLKADFCDNHHKCFELINSTQNILLNGINSAVSLYGKEIENFYKDYIKVKNILKTKEDIKRYFIKDTFEILGLNLNHIFSHLQERFFNDFLKDEEDLKRDFNNEIKILNIIALCYSLLLNLFSILYVFNYINSINDFVEISSLRINMAICHLKEKIKIMHMGFN